jgi:hypothetical protein
MKVTLTLKLNNTDTPCITSQDNEDRIISQGGHQQQNIQTGQQGTEDDFPPITRNP